MTSFFGAVSALDFHCNDRIVWISQQILPHEPDVRRWLRGFRDIDTDDVIQECYAILLDVEVAAIQTPRAYFFRIARNIVFQQYRRAKVVSITALAEFAVHGIADDASCPHRTIEARQELERLHHMMQDLPERCRQVLLLRKLEGLSQRQVSERLGISENIVEKQVARGLRALSRLFCDDRPTPPKTRPAPMKKVTTLP